MKPLTKYFVSTYVLSWIFFISVAFLSHTTTAMQPGMVLLQQALALLGAIMPSLVALTLTATSGVQGQAEQLVSGIGKWKVSISWYLFAAGFIAVTKLVVALIDKSITGRWPPFGDVPWYQMLAAVFFSTWVQAGEEIGWRGFALPRMWVKMGLPVSTVLLGIIWASWHLPLFFVKDASTYSQSFPLYLIEVTALSIIMGWLYWKTKGSLLLVMLFHAAVNNTKDIVPSASADATDPFSFSRSLVAWTTVALLVIFASYCLISMRRASLPVESISSPSRRAGHQ